MNTHAKCAGFVKVAVCRCPSLELIRPNLDLWRNFVKFVILAELPGFVKIATLLVPFSRAHSLLSGSRAKFRQILHSRRISQNRRFVGTLLLSPIIRSHLHLWRNLVKFAISFIAFIFVNISGEWENMVGHMGHKVIITTLKNMMGWKLQVED